MEHRRVISCWYMLSGLLTAMLLLPSCRVEVNSGPSRMAVTGPQNWEMEGRRYPVETTYVISRIDLPGSPVQFTVNYVCGQCAFSKMTDEEAMVVALPIMSYVYKNGLYKHTKISLNGVAVEPKLIGVVLVEPGSHGQKGYRIARPIDEIGSLSRSVKL
jgi:hypothetical protein